MNTQFLFDFEVDKANSKIHVKRLFDAPVDMVWDAWTQADILDQWWAPKPWRAITKSMDFREGGRWHYYMLSPDGTEKHWCLFDYEKIVPQQSFSGIDSFCDENQVMNDSKPRVRWSNSFHAQDEATIVNIELLFNSLEDLETIIQMGFKEGFTMGLENLDAYLKSQSNLRL